MAGTSEKLSNAVEAYFDELGKVRASGGGTGELSYYPALAKLLGAVGGSLKPILRVGQVRESLPNLFERSRGPRDRMLAMWKVRWRRAYDQATKRIFACPHGVPASNPVATGI